MSVASSTVHTFHLNHLCRLLSTQDYFIFLDEINQHDVCPTVRYHPPFLSVSLFVFHLLFILFFLFFCSSSQYSYISLMSECLPSGNI